MVERHRTRHSTALLLTNNTMTTNIQSERSIGSETGDSVADTATTDNDRLQRTDFNTVEHPKFSRKIEYFDLSSSDGVAIDDDTSLGEDETSDDSSFHRLSADDDDDADEDSHLSASDLQDQLATIRTLFKRAVTVNKLHSASWVAWAKFEQKSGHPGETDVI